MQLMSNISVFVEFASGKIKWVQGEQPRR